MPESITVGRRRSLSTRFASDDSKLVERRIEGGAGDIAEKIVENESAGLKFTFQRFRIKMLEPVVNHAGPRFLDNRVFIQ